MPKAVWVSHSVLYLKPIKFNYRKSIKHNLLHPSRRFPHFCHFEIVHSSTKNKRALQSFLFTYFILFSFIDHMHIHHAHITHSKQCSARSASHKSNIVRWCSKVACMQSVFICKTNVECQINSPRTHICVVVVVDHFNSFDCISLFRLASRVTFIEATFKVVGVRVDKRKDYATKILSCVIESHQKTV